MSSGQDPALVELPSADEWTALTAAGLAATRRVGVPFLVEPPASLALRLARTPVDAVELPDGRIAMLLKTVIGWKDNFRGLLLTTAPVTAAEVKQDSRGRQFISLPAPPPWEELYVQKKRSDQVWEVFFDLN